MLKKTNLAWLLLTLVFVASADPAKASLMSFPKLLTNPFVGLEGTKLLWGPPSFDLNCITGRDKCPGVVKKAALFGAPKALKRQLDRLPLASSALPPMAHSVFCFQYPQDCKVRKMAFRGRKYELTPERWQGLVEVNSKVNRSIRPERNTIGLAGEKWIVAPKSGDCNDYAVTKQHELLARGWPSRTLLLAEVVTHWGEHHLILVVRTGSGDFVLDSMNPNIRPWSKAPYRWVRVQSPSNPRAWSTVRSTNA